ATGGDAVADSVRAPSCAARACPRASAAGPLLRHTPEPATAAAGSNHPPAVHYRTPLSGACSRRVRARATHQPHTAAPYGRRHAQAPYGRRHAPAHTGSTGRSDRPSPLGTTWRPTWRSTPTSSSPASAPRTLWVATSPRPGRAPSPVAPV